MIISHHYKYKLLSLVLPDIIWTINSTNPTVCLTFDDGPHPAYTPQILDILKCYHAKATFFLLGSKARDYPNIVTQINQAGHTIGLHSQTHQKLILKKVQDLIHELREPQKILEKIIGQKPVLFRPPYGYFTPRLIKLCRDMKLTFVLWSTMSYDFNLKFSDQRVIDRIIRRLKNGVIVVLHDGHINSERTVRILPCLMEQITKLNFCVKGLNELNGRLGSDLYYDLPKSLTTF